VECLSHEHQDPEFKPQLKKINYIQGFTGTLSVLLRNINQSFLKEMQPIKAVNVQVTQMSLLFFLFLF
jgi:hypothetical protein